MDLNRLERKRLREIAKYNAMGRGAYPSWSHKVIKSLIAKGLVEILRTSPRHRSRLAYLTNAGREWIAANPKLEKDAANVC